MANPSADDARSVDIEHLEKQIDQEIGISAWHRVDQTRIDAFAEATEDWQFIHVDPERARAALPLGGTIAHGFLILSLLSVMAAEAVPPISGLTMGMNYGFDKVRFLAPVVSGTELRARFVVKGIERQNGGRSRVRYDVQMEARGQSKPVLIAEWIVLLQIGI
jgi:acyl dehydratase